MEIVQYFFGDVWHFLLLLLVCAVLSPKVTIYNNDKEEKQ